MAKSLLFLPHISGFSEFVQSTEVEHSQHVVAELLELLIDANSAEMTLAEIEGDVLFLLQRWKSSQAGRSSGADRTNV